MSHFLLLCFHAVLVAVFFGFLTRDRAAGRLRVTVAVFVGMVLGALLLAWAMYPFPVQGSGA